MVWARLADLGFAQAAEERSTLRRFRQDLQFARNPPTIRIRKPACKAGGWSTLVEPTFIEQGLDSTIGSVCRVRQSGMPNEPRGAPPS